LIVFRLCFINEDLASLPLSLFCSSPQKVGCTSQSKTYPFVEQDLT